MMLLFSVAFLNICLFYRIFSPLIFYNSKSPQHIEVLVGTNETNSGGDRYSVNETILHEKFDSQWYTNNIGLVRLLTPIQFNDRVQPIQLGKDVVPENTDLVVSGFGVLWVG